MRKLYLILLIVVFASTVFSQQISEKQKELWEATKANDTAKVLALAGEGVDVNFGDARENRTPLMIAAANGNIELMKLFIEKRTAVDAVDKNGTTAVYYAILRNKPAATELLIEQKTDVNHKSTTGLTPLMGAARFGRAGIIPLLLKAGAKVNEQNESKITALHFAVAGGDEKTVGEILKAKPDIHLKDKRGETPIITALTRGGRSADKTVPMLLELGADPNNTDSMGWNTLMIAVIKGRRDLLVPLLEAGADPFHKNNRGEDVFALLQTTKRDGFEKIIRENMLDKYKKQ